jgi:hypothetical protein
MWWRVAREGIRWNAIARIIVGLPQHAGQKWILEFPFVVRCSAQLKFANHKLTNYFGPGGPLTINIWGALSKNEETIEPAKGPLSTNKRAREPERAVSFASQNIQNDINCVMRDCEGFNNLPNYQICIYSRSHSDVLYTIYYILAVCSVYCILCIVYYILDGVPYCILCIVS